MLADLTARLDGVFACPAITHAASTVVQYVKEELHAGDAGSAAMPPSLDAAVAAAHAGSLQLQMALAKEMAAVADHPWLGPTERDALHAALKLLAVRRRQELESLREEMQLFCSWRRWRTNLLIHRRYASAGAGTNELLTLLPIATGALLSDWLGEESTTQQARAGMRIVQELGFHVAAVERGTPIAVKPYPDERQRGAIRLWNGGDSSGGIP
jgi:hypothetical protein